MLDVDLPEDVSLHSGTFRHSTVRRCTVSAAASLYQPNMKAVQTRHTDPALCCTCELSHNHRMTHEADLGSYISL